MQFTTLALAALASALVSAAPTNNDALPKRSCAVQYPNSLGFPINFHLAKNAAVDITATLGFTIPAGAVGPCSLVAEFPANYPIATSGNSQVNVRALDGPAPGSLIGTYTFAQSADARYNTINSFACRPNFTFEFEIAGTEGAVDFAEVQNAGLIMTYNC